MEKIYFSENEFYSINKKDKSKSPFVGYVIIKDGVPYDKKSGDKLVISDNYISSVNLSDKFFDRNLEDKLSLPHSIEECTFQVNDFLKASVINKIIKNIEENNRYIFNNCIVPKNNLPLADKIPVLAPERRFTQVNGKYDKELSITHGFDNVSGWLWSDISNKYIQNIWKKGGLSSMSWKNFVKKWKDANISWRKANAKSWPESIPGYNWYTDDITDAVIVPTDKNYKEDLEDLPENKLFATFISGKTYIKLINLYLCPEDIISNINDRLSEDLTDEEITAEYEKREFLELSPDNIGKQNLDIITFSHIDPNDNNSLAFKNISSIAIDGNNLYVVDSELNGLFKYDISKCLTYRGVATNKITLLGYIQSTGTIENPLAFNKPISVSAKDGKIAVLDANNSCIKLFDTYLNPLYTISEGGFVRQDPKSVSICPYDFYYKNLLVKAGSILVLSSAGVSISVDIYLNNGTYIGSKVIKTIELTKTYWRDASGKYSNISEPLYHQEEIKKIVFSANNSNFFYILTTDRVIKFQFSQFGNPLGVISYGYNINATDEITWETLNQPWETVVGSSEGFMNWENSDSEFSLICGINKCLAITSIDGINTDIIFSIIDNRTFYSNGKVQRVDTYRVQQCAENLDNEGNIIGYTPLYITQNGDITIEKENNYILLRDINELVKKYNIINGNLVESSLYEYISEQNSTKENTNNLLYIDNMTGNITYDKITNNKANMPIYISLSDTIKEYSMMISNDKKTPYFTEKYIKSEIPFDINNNISNVILFFKEPNIFESSLLSTNLKLFSLDEILCKNDSEYFNHFTINKIIYKLLYNITEIKKYIYGNFSAGYSTQNIMTFSQVNPDFSIQKIGTEFENYIIGENEPVSIILNRCFENILNIQLNLLEKLQTRVINAIEYNKNNYSII